MNCRATSEAQIVSKGRAQVTDRALVVSVNDLVDFQHRKGYDDRY